MGDQHKIEYKIENNIYKQHNHPKGKIKVRTKLIVLTYMATLDMLGPFPLTDEEVNKRVMENKKGNYAYGYIEDKDKKKVFIVRYVGRSDTDLCEEIKSRHKSDKKFTEQDCQCFKFSYASSAKEAYEKECRNFHDFGENIHLLNEVHPAKPEDFKDYKCPITSCCN